MTASWKLRSIGSIATVIAGQSPNGRAYNEDGDGLAFHQGKTEFGLRFIGPPKKWTTEVTKTALPGDILISVRAPVGPINETTEAICIGRGLAAIRPHKCCDKNYLWYALLWLQPSITGRDGAVFPSITRTQIEALEIPLPPIEEQHRIVALLDEALEGLDRAKTNAEANLANTEELFYAHLNQTYDKNLEKFGSKRIDELCDSITDCVNRTAPTVDAETNFKMIRTTNIKNGKLNLANCKHVSEDTFHHWTRRQVPASNDVLLTRKAPVGETAVITDEENVFLGQRIVSYRCNQKKVLPLYLMNALRSKFLQGQFTKLENGATVKHIRVPQAKKLKIQYADLGTQKNIISTITELQLKIEKLRYAFSQQKSQIVLLRKAILQKAFAGELT